MDSELTKKWRELFKKNCSQWNDSDKMRYINIANDPHDIDEEELKSACELIQEINKKPAVE